MNKTAKIFLTYWVIGCLVYGLGLGALLSKCSTFDVASHIKAIDVFTIVLTWPAVFSGVFTYTSNPNFTTNCFG